MTSIMDGGDELAMSALAECSFAAALIPAAWPCVKVIATNQSNPDEIYDRGLAWLRLADELRSAADALGDTVDGLSEADWSGDDRAAFDQRVTDEIHQLTLTCGLALVVGVALVALSIVLFTLIVVMATIATALLVVASLIMGAAMGVLTSPWAVTLEFEAEFFAAECLTVLESVAGIATTTGHTCAAAIQGAMCLDARLQALAGNDHVRTEALGALLNSIDDVIWGMFARLERDASAMMAGAGSPIGVIATAVDDRTDTGQPIATQTARDLWDRDLEEGR